MNIATTPTMSSASLYEIANPDFRYGAVAQIFFYMKDPETGEPIFLLAERSKKTGFGGRLSPLGGMKSRVGWDILEALRREIMKQTGAGHMARAIYGKQQGIYAKALSPGHRQIGNTPPSPVC